MSGLQTFYPVNYSRFVLVQEDRNRLETLGQKTERFSLPDGLGPLVVGGGDVHFEPFALGSKSQLFCPHFITGVGRQWGDLTGLNIDGTLGVP